MSINSNYITLNQLINAKMLYDNMLLNSKMIANLIHQDEGSVRKQDMATGERYFNAKHDILNHVNYYYVNGKRVEDRIKSNERIPHPFHQLLVIQKAAYIAGNPIKVSTNKKQLATEEFKKFIQEFNNIVEEQFDDIINDLIIGASNKAEEWIHFYIDAEGELRFIIADAKELIPVYDTQYNKNLVGMIRYYKVEEHTIDGNTTVKNEVYKVEWWTDTDVTYYTETEAGDFIPDFNYKINPSKHWYTYNSIEGESASKPGSWGRVPFIKLQNNSANTNDLKSIKALIDAYDVVKSGWLNDIKDFQELILILKGYSGIVSVIEREAGFTELDVFMQNLKAKKVIPVEEGGGVDSLNNEIPVEAKTKFLDITRKEIFFFGYGIDIDTDKFASAPSGVSLKFLYSLLDLKANALIRKLKITLQSFVEFISIYLQLTKKITYDVKQITFLINKSMIFNEAEKITSVKSSDGIISERTMLENHPFVEDVEEELLRLADQRNTEFKNQLTLLEKQLEAKTTEINEEDEQE